MSTVGQKESGIRTSQAIGAQTSRRVITLAVTLIVFILLTVSRAVGQSPSGTIRGTVSDASGAAIPNAIITVTNVQTNETMSTKSDPVGRFIFPIVPPSMYSVTAQATGFETVEQKNILVQIAVGSPVDFKLPVAQVSQNVQVTASTPALQTTTATLSTTVNSTLIADIPLNGRNPTSLEVLVPGVSTVGVGGTSYTPRIAGSRSANNEENIDGMTNILPDNNVGLNTSAYTPIVDSVEEFSVQTSVLPAQYGRFSGGEISLLTRSGSNHFHGTLFDFTQTNALYAKPYFSSGPIPSSHLYQFGGTVGGPIFVPRVYNGHNKSFFFFAFEDSKQAQANAELDSVPTAAERTGDFSAAGTTIYNPYTATLQTSGQYVRTAFPNNQIPAELQSSVALKALSYIPLPNTGPANAQFNNYSTSGPSSNDYYHFDLRLDHDFTSKWHSFVRFSHLNNPSSPFSDYNSAASRGGTGPSITTAYSASFDNTVTVSPSLVLDLRAGFSRSAYTRTAFGEPFDLGSLDLPSSFATIAAREPTIFPYFEMGDGYSDFGSNGYVPLQANPSAVDVNPSAVKTIHGNSITFGGEWRKLFENFYQLSYPSGTFGSINHDWTQDVVNQYDGTGNAVATLLLGLADGGYMSHDTSAATSSAYGALFIEDDYQAAKNLTFNIGLRWDVDIPRTERHNALAYWDPTLPSPLAGKVPASACLYCGNLMGQMVFVGTPQSKYGRHQGPTQWKDFAPRLGFAWSLDSKTDVRGGWGLVFQPSELQAAGTTGGLGDDGYTSYTNFNFTYDNQQTIATTYDNPAASGYDLPTGASLGASTYLGENINYTFFDTYRNPYSVEGNFSIQRALPGNMVVTVGYIYNRGNFLINGDPGVPFSQVDPSYLSLGTQLTTNVPNPFYGLVTTPGSPLAAATVPYNYLLRPFPQYNGVQSQRKADSGSHYNGFTAKLDKRYGQGLTLIVAFTAGKLMDNAGSVVSYLGPVSETYSNQYNPKAEFGLSSQDQSRLLSTGYSYELPFGKSREFFSHGNGFANELIGGWQTNGLIQWNTGTPIVLGGVNQDQLLGFNQRPDEAPGDPRLSHPTRAKWFNTALFSVPAEFTIGNAPRVLANVRAPSYIDADMSLFKNNYIGAQRRFNLQFRMEAFNVFNHPIFGGPDTGVTDGTFGQINSQANSPRQVQLAVKFIY